METDLLTLLEVHHWAYNKIRLGKNNDGGYVICDIPNIEYDSLLSCGINQDISFDKDFLNTYSTTQAFAFDGTIKHLPPHNKNINFIKKNIGKDESEQTTNLKQYLNQYKNIFLKMDIEGGEYEWIKSLNEIESNNIAQIVVEIHSNDIEVVVDFIQKLNKTHVLFHVHANNYQTNFYSINNIKICKVLELTFVRKNHIDFKLQKNTLPLPSILDQSNKPNGKDIDLNYYPFCFKQEAYR